MEHELFQSKLKSSVNIAFLSKMIRSSSSGENLHQAAAMELILERSIQERHQRTLAKAQNTLQLDPSPQPKEGSEELSTSIPPTEPSTPAPALQLAPQRSTRKPQLTSSETAPNPKLVSKPVMTQGDPGKHRKPVRVRCSVSNCGSILRQSELKDGFYCCNCPNQVFTFCLNCGHCRNTNVRKCESCGLEFVK